MHDRIAQILLLPAAPTCMLSGAIYLKMYLKIGVAQTDSRAHSKTHYT